VLAVGLAFGAAALMYLAVDELLVEAHEERETTALSGLFFVGFLCFYVLAEIAGGRPARLSDRRLAVSQPPPEHHRSGEQGQGEQARTGTGRRDPSASSQPAATGAGVPSSSRRPLRRRRRRNPPVPRTRATSTVWHDRTDRVRRTSGMQATHIGSFARHRTEPEADAW
jgi:hypothetical protein